MKLYKPIDGLIDAGGRRRRRRWMGVGVVGFFVGGFVVVYLAASGSGSDEGPPPGAPAAADVIAGLQAGAPVTDNPGVHPAAPMPFGAQNPSGSAPPTPVVAPVGEAAVDDEPGEAPAAPKAVVPELQVPTLDPKATKKKPVPGFLAAGGEFEGKIGKGESLYLALVGKRFTAKQISPAIHALGKKVDFRKTRPGDRWRAKHDATGRILELQYQRTEDRVHIAVYKPGKGYEVKQRSVPIETRVSSIGGTVRSSVYKALLELGEAPAIIRQFINVFRYDFDFAGDAKEGDTFRVVYEQVYVDGKFVRNGRILAAEYTGKKKSLRAYWFPDSATYFEQSGQSLRRMFLKNPVPFSRVTSKFGRRFHPVLKRWAQHNGVDYAASRGSEIHALADGTVSFAGKKGANGNLVAIKHPNGMISYYAHQSRFAKGIAVGTRVKQGQLIGFVGSTGRSTGPHLHLAIRGKKGYLDPMGLKSTRGVQLSGRPLIRFRAGAKKLDRRLDATEVSPPSDSPPEPEPVGGDDLGEAVE
jgi:murein DD-endopeptidase MepM/ murein hydrolase activator NlpD